MKDKNILLQYAQIGDNEKNNKLIISDNSILEQKVAEDIIVKSKVKDGKIIIKVEIPTGVKVKKPINICFGALHGKVNQDIDFKIKLNRNSSAVFSSYCILISDEKINHTMNSEIIVEEGAEYIYLEKHIHGKKGNIVLKPSSKVKLGKKSTFKLDFELLEGRAGETTFDYDVETGDGSSVEMETRLKALGDDKVVLRENVNLKGKRSKALLKSRVAALDNSDIEIFNTISAKGSYSRGHIDCQEVLLGNGKVKAYPNAEVINSTSHITHEASLGGLDNIKMETLMSRGKSEAEAEEILLQGMLSKK